MEEKLHKSKTKKPWLKKILSATCALFLILAFYVLYQAFHLQLWVKSEQTDVRKLSAAEKTADFRYLTRFVREVYPYNDAVMKYLGLENVEALEEEYITMAGQTKNNSDFFKLVLEYVQRLRQGSGHNGIYFGQSQAQNNTAYHSYVYDIKRSSYFKTDYWGKEAGKFKWNAFSDAKVGYKNGEYVLLDEYRLAETTLPSGTTIEKINGMPTDAYVKLLQNRTRLLYDSNLNKGFVPSLFSTDDAPASKEWDVEFKLAGKTVVRGKLKKYTQVTRDENILDSLNYPNIVCKELNEKVGYMKILSFGAEHADSDKDTIRRFIADSNGKFSKLIIDIRGNTGGELTYWSDNIIEPLIREPKTSVQFTAVKKEFFRWMGIRYHAYRWLFSNDILQKDLNHIVDIEKTKDTELREEIWDVFKITKRFVPNNSLPFKGKIYILTDQNTFSAADAFAATAKNINFGEVIGTNTAGAGNIFISPIDICLPNSQILLRMDVELNLNDKGQPDHICGTIPDVVLAPSSYPAQSPKSLEPEDLSEDSWISWAMNN